MMSTNADDLRTRVSDVLASEVGPALQMDGGNIELVDIEQGIVRVRLHGTCSGCPSTIMAVVMGIEAELSKRVPEVSYVEVVP